MRHVQPGRLLGAAVVAVLAVGLAACGPDPAAAGGAGPQRADEITIGVGADEGTLTPYTQQTGYPGNNLVALVYDTLLDRDAENELKPLLAKDVKASANNTVFTVALRSGVTWHDGEPFTAADVAFSVDYYREHPQGDSASSIEAVQQVRPGEGAVVFTLAAPDPDFPSRLLTDLRILPKHVWQSIDRPETATVEQAIGTGPYKLSAHTKGQGYELTANPDYAMGEPRIRTVRISIIPQQQTAIAALRTGEVSVLSGTVPDAQASALERQPTIEVARGSSFTSTLLAVNNGRAPFDDPTVRAAISAAIDQEKLIGTVLRGRGRPGSPGFWHPDAKGADAGLSHTHDPRRAARLLDEVGARPGADGVRVLAGKPMSYSLLVQSSSPPRIRAAELIRDMLAEVGVAITVSTLDSDSVDAKVWPGLDVGNGRDYELAMWGWSAPTMLDATSLANLLDSDTSLGRLNITGTADPDLDRVAGQLRDATTADARLAALTAMQRLVAEKTPFVTLYYPQESFGYRSDVYDGWVYQAGQGPLNLMSFVDMRW